MWRGLPPIPNKIASHVRQDYTISISWAEGSKSSVQPSSNGSWFCPMMCLILTPSFFLGSTGQGVQQASTGCSQMNPEMPLLWQRLATSIREAMHVTGAWNQITNLASYGNEPWKDIKRHNFRSWLRNLDKMTHCLWKRQVPSVYQLWRLLLCMRSSKIWRSKFRFKIVIWRVSEKYSIQNAPLKLWSQPATYTQPAQLSLSETDCCCHLLPTSTEVLPCGSQPGVLLCAKALGFFFQLQHSSLLWWIASDRLGLIHSSRMHNTDAQVSGLLTPSMWCLNTKHVMGWDEDASRASWQTNSFENMVSFFIVLLPRRINWLRLVTYIFDGCVLAKWSCIFPKPGKLVPSIV